MSEAATCEAICLAVVHALRAERLRRGLSMDRLAAKAGLSKGMISLVERDLRNPTLDTVLRISRALEVDLGRVIRAATDQVAQSKRR